MSVGEEEEILGDILLHRFIKGWSAAKTMMYINDHYNEYLDDRTFRRKQEQALWEGALMCPDDAVRIQKWSCPVSAGFCPLFAGIWPVLGEIGG